MSSVRVGHQSRGCRSSACQSSPTSREIYREREREYRLVDDVSLDVRERQLVFADTRLAGNGDLDGNKVRIGSRIHSRRTDSSARRCPLLWQQQQQQQQQWKVAGTRLDGGETSCGGGGV